MKRTYTKMLLRGVRKTGARFISILAIVAVGVGFLGGLLATTPDMQLTVDKYYDEARLFDIDIKGTAGLTDADIGSLSQLSFVESIMPAYVTDINMQDNEGTYVTRIYGVPLDTRGSADFLNDIELLEGRLPRNSSECLIASPNGYSASHDIGEVYSLSEDNKDYDKLGDTYNFTELTVVGIVSSPYYMSVESEPSTVGTGTVSLIMYVLPECYSLEVYTDIFISVAGAESLNSFSDEYQQLIDDAADKLESWGLARCYFRYDEIVSEANDKLNDAVAEYDDAKRDAERELADARAELDDGYAQLRSARASVQSSINDLNTYQSQLDSGRAQLSAARQQLSDALAQQRAQLDAALAVGAVSQTEYDAGMQQIAAQETAGVAQLDAQQAQLDALQTQIDSGWSQVNQANRDIADAEDELASGESKYKKAKKEAEQELADAWQEIEDAKQDIADIECPEWYVSDRGDTVSYTSYKSNSEKIAAIAKVFPIFLFVVAALVALTTMTRLVEEERTQIGTLKAIGFSDAVIMAYYIGYSVLASLLGSIVGLLIGFKTLPVVISNAYSMMYTLPKTLTPFWWNYALTVSAVAIACTTVATLVACLDQLKEKPATLMLPKAPAKGKRVLLERIGFVWKRLSFTHKVTARNILRYKKRFFMTVIGIAGCCALLVTGFGLRDSIHDIVDLQFGEIYNYNVSMLLADDGDAENDEVVADFLASSAVDSYAVVHSETAYVENAQGSGKVTLYVPQDTRALEEMLTLRERSSGAAIPFEDDSVILTEKLCETLGVAVGDTVTVRLADGGSAEFTVSGIAENYVAAYVFISSGMYEQSYGATPEYRLVLARIYDQDADSREAISKQVLASDNVQLLQFTQTIRDSFANTVKNIDYIVMVLIVSAGLLAVVVLYNLTNINICERKKELATLKVLGFHDRETASYIFREINILCVIGTALGLGLGVLLHRFVVKSAEVDAVMFGRTISAPSFLYAALVTLFFAALVDLIMLPQVRKISMVESMKANE